MLRMLDNYPDLKRTKKMKSYDEIVEILRKEALTDPETGWLSDMGHYRLGYVKYNQTIEVGNGSIDLSHLASIILEILEGQR